MLCSFLEEQTNVDCDRNTHFFSSFLILLYYISHRIGQQNTIFHPTNKEGEKWRPSLQDILILQPIFWSSYHLVFNAYSLYKVELEMHPR